MNKVRQITGILTQALLISIFIYCLLAPDLVIYGIKQAYGQVNIIYNTQAVEEVLNSADLSYNEKEKIKLIQRVKLFSVNSLGYKESGSYTNYYNQKKSPPLLVVTACEPFSFKAYTWKFPVLGEVSYKGFFDNKAGLDEYYRLIKLGYDTDIGQVSAWSTLGYFNDPILSSMLKRTNGRLSNLIFHELFHNTYYAKSSVEMNENLANFIAHKATVLFLKNDSINLREYLKMRADDSLNTSFILNAAKSLDSLYKTFQTNDTLACNLKKKELLKDIYYQTLKIPFNYPNRFREHHKDILLTKNAFFMDYKRYDAHYDSLNNILKNSYKNDLKKMILDLRLKND